jgi:hypothetical protein
MKRKRLEENNCNNVPKQKKLNAEQQQEYREIRKNLSVEYIRNYRVRKAQEKAHKHLRPLNLHQLQLYTIIIKPINTLKEFY